MARSRGPGDLLERSGPPPSNDIVRRMRRGALLHLDGDTEEAARIYRSVLDDEPAHAVAHNNLGFLLAQGGDLEAAITHYQAALEADPGSSMAMTNLGNARISQGNPSGVQLLESATDAAPDNVVAWDSLGRARLLFGDLDGAEQALRRAVHLDSGNAMILVTLGAVLAARGRIPEAIAILEAAVDRDPAAPAAWHQLGMARFAHNDLGAASTAFATAVQLDPRRVDARRQLALTLAALGQTDRATAELRQVLDVADHPDIVVDLAILELAGGEFDRARARLAEISDENNERARFHLALAELACGNSDAAAQHLTALAVLDSPLGVKARDYLSTMSTESG